MNRPLDFSEQPGPTVVLRHDLPDGAHHFDWMIAQDPRGVRLLITFRMDRRIDQLAIDEAADATRLDDHRPIYLTYEGEISGNRGRVTRLREGRVEALRELEHGAVELGIAWLGPQKVSSRQRIRLEPDEVDRWIVVLTPQEGRTR
jgi:hypothetical protein